MPEQAKALFRKKLNGRYAWLDGQLAGKQYLMGDACLFTVTHWSRHVGVDTQSRPNVVAYMARVAARSAVQVAIAASAASSPRSRLTKAMSYGAPTLFPPKANLALTVGAI